MDQHPRLDGSVSTEATRVGDGVYRVVVDGRSEIAWAVSAAGEQWAFWNGRVFTIRRGDDGRGPQPRRAVAEGHQSLASPMPATVLKVLVMPGTRVRKGDTIMILEAMKMELPVRATADGVVRTVSCREGELVQAGARLVELE
jgi:biotin carboxyl carrier protein